MLRHRPLCLAPRQLARRRHRRPHPLHRQLLRRPARSGVKSGAYAARSGVKSDAYAARNGVKSGAKVAGSDEWRGGKAARSDVRYGAQVARRNNSNREEALHSNLVETLSHQRRRTVPNPDRGNRSPAATAARAPRAATQQPRRRAE